MLGSLMLGAVGGRKAALPLGIVLPVFILFTHRSPAKQDQS